MFVSGLIAAARDIPSGMNLVRTLMTARMPEDRAMITRAISDFPYRHQGALKGMACWWFYRRTGVNYPHSVAIDTTLACNFACPHCYLATIYSLPANRTSKRACLSTNGSCGCAG